MYLTGHYDEYLNGVSNIEGGYFRFINILAALDQPVCCLCITEKKYQNQQTDINEKS